jgi:hypothetical protein
MNLRPVAIDHAEDRWLLEEVADDPEAKPVAVVFGGAAHVRDEEMRAADEHPGHLGLQGAIRYRAPQCGIEGISSPPATFILS